VGIERGKKRPKTGRSANQEKKKSGIPVPKEKTFDFFRKQKERVQLRMLTGKGKKTTGASALKEKKNATFHGGKRDPQEEESAEGKEGREEVLTSEKKNSLYHYKKEKDSFGTPICSRKKIPFGEREQDSQNNG